MADENDQSVMFEIGVMEHPATKARLEALTKQVVDAQAKMTQAVDRVGIMAQAVGSSMQSVTTQLKEYRDTSVGSLDEVRGAITRLHAAAEVRSEKVVEVVIRGADRVAELEAHIERVSKSRSVDLPKSSGADENVISGEDGSVSGGENDGLPSNLRNVFKELEQDAKRSAKEIGNELDAAISGLPTSVTANTALLKKEYDKRIEDQRKAWKEMDDDLKDAVSNQGEATEMMNSQIVKGARSMIGMTKGFAELGLMSAESTEQLAKGMVVIQGVFDIVDGANDLLEVFNGAWKASTKSVEAANKVAEIQKAMMGPQFAQLQAYQAQLARETIAANAATAANMRLSASRGGKGGSVGGVAGGAVSGAAEAVGGAVATKVASSMGVKAAAGAGTAAAGAGVAAAGGTAAAGAGVAAVGGTSAAASGVVAIAPFVAAVSAVAGALGVLYMATRQVSEGIQGKAQNDKSFAMQSAKMQVGAAASVAGMLGLFQKLDSPSTKMAQAFGKQTDAMVSSIPGLAKWKDQINVVGGLIGDLAGLVQSTAAVARAEKSLKKNKILNAQKEDVANVTRDAQNEKDQLVFKNDVRASRVRSDNVGSVDAVLANEMKVMAEAERGRATSQAAVDKAKEGGEVDGKAESNIKFFTEMLMQSQERQNAAVKQSGGGRLADEKSIDDDIIVKMTEAQERLNKLKESGLENEKEGEDVAAQIAGYAADREASLERQRSIVKDSLSAEVSGQGKIQDLLRAQLDTKTQSLQKSQDAQTSAMSNFAKLGDIEKKLAKEALDQARKKGAESLSDSQKDLLGSIGTTETKRFVREGDEAEARKFGFSEENFGQGFAAEQAGLVKEKQEIEARLSSTYDVNVTVQNNTNAIVDAVAGQVEEIMAKRQEVIMEGIDRRLQASTKDINERTSDQIKLLKAGKG